ncbi:peptide-methionine (S)-S-oxide reductase MsrA [Gleimia sp. 6138-11-ORH1]|uniref:peptide-methionine (S)-S-oxide reductase MsrA n=1 Tax=Gleimia sp. 6138-11-ORH1 TaxID=2973937 RepID=UPI00216AAFC0|nr:peptide-methionine (S)-S-oxide reductase MsrA [Gleimia sp. 6138-11-ORH1]MCS4485219.1 peptide-methionine (S)-S-oxide reductase MsrA [Gleimia sp. 6138-11-ORH1]
MAILAGSYPDSDVPVCTIPGIHPVLGNPIAGPWDAPYEILYVGMGCYWGAERIMWRLPGVIATAVGFMGGTTRNPSYKAVCTGKTGHAEVVRVVYNPQEIDAEEIIKAFWENHDPTQGDRQGNDRGTQYRSVLFTTTARQLALAQASKEAYGKVLAAAGFGPITTEVDEAANSGIFYLAEGYHQAYLHHIPDGYCNHGPNGYACPTGLLPEGAGKSASAFPEVSKIQLP